MMDGISRIAGGVAVGVIGMVALFFAGGGSVEDAGDAVGLSPASDRCHPGWKDTSGEADHAIVLKCERTITAAQTPDSTKHGDWFVYLRDGDEFSHARHKDGPFVYEESAVPAW